MIKKHYEDKASNFVSENLYLNKYHNKSNVLMLGWEFPPQMNGGLGVACYGILKALNDLNVSIDFALPNLMPVNPVKHNFIFANQINNIGIEEINVIKSELKLERFDYYTGQKRYSDFKIAGENFFSKIHNHSKTNLEHISKSFEERVENYSIDLLKFLYLFNKQYDIVHAHDWLTVPTAIAIKKMFGTPFILHVHATQIDRVGLHPNDEIFQIELEGMQEATKIICVSNYTKEILIKHYHIEAYKIEVVHNGIDLESFNPIEVDDEKKIAIMEEFFSLKDEGYKFVLSVGRLTHQKGIEFLLQAAKIVKQFESKVFFLIAGRGDQEKWLIEETANMGLGDKVIFCGWQDEATVKALYTLSDIFIMPSRSEPFGLVALEAALHSTPVIASKTSGAIEILPHSLVLDYWDTEKLANNILAILNYPALRDTISDMAFEHVLNLDWSKPTKKIMQLYEENKLNQNNYQHSG